MNVPSPLNDFEDIALGRCAANSVKHCIYIGEFKYALPESFDQHCLQCTF